LRITNCRIQTEDKKKENGSNHIVHRTPHYAPTHFKRQLIISLLKLFAVL